MHNLLAKHRAMQQSALSDIWQTHAFCSHVVDGVCAQDLALLGRLRLVSSCECVRSILRGITVRVVTGFGRTLREDTACARAALRYILCVAQRDEAACPCLQAMFSTLAESLPRVHDYTTRHEVQCGLRRYCSSKYRQLGVTALVLRVFERLPIAAHKGAGLHELCLHIMRSGISIVDGDLCMLFEFEHLDADIQERLCISICVLYDMATHDRLQEITTIYLLETLARVHFSPTVFNTLLSRLGQCIADRNYFMAQFVHGALARVLLKTSEPYMLVRYLVQNDVLDHVLLQYHQHCQCPHIEVHSSYCSLLSHIVHNLQHVPSHLFAQIYQVLRAPAWAACPHRTLRAPASAACLHRTSHVPVSAACLHRTSHVPRAGA